MTKPVTVEMLKTATMRATCFLDGEDFYSNTSQCVEYPELTKCKSGPASGYGSNPKKKGEEPRKHTVTLYVAGQEVPMDLQAIADAINAYRAKKVSP